MVSPGSVDGYFDESRGSTEARDIYGTRIRLMQDDLTYGKEFVSFEEMGGMQPVSHIFWNPHTRLFEVAVL